MRPIPAGRSPRRVGLTLAEIRIPAPRSWIIIPGASMLSRGSSDASLQAAPIPRGPDLTPCGRACHPAGAGRGSKSRRLGTRWRVRADPSNSVPTRPSKGDFPGDCGDITREEPFRTAPSASFGRECTVVQLHDPVAQVIVAVVMADHDDSLAAVSQLRQEALVEDLPVVRVLVRGPFIEDIDRAVLGNEVRGRGASAVPVTARSWKMLRLKSALSRPAPARPGSGLRGRQEPGRGDRAGYRIDKNR